MFCSTFCFCTFALSFYYYLPPMLAQLTHPSQVSSLEAIHTSLIDPKNNLKNWKNGDPCISNWTGVLCFDGVAPDGYFHVRELLLMNMDLSGNLASQIGQLSHLQILNFMWNDLTGTIPREIGDISTLRLLLLNGNRFSGILPDELGYLTNLDRFQIDQNQISGSIPKSFANLNSIKHIHFNNNSLSGQIPDELSNLSTLNHLLLDNNNLSGYLPSELSNIPELVILQLDNNNFSGTQIPASYGNMHKLVKLSVRNCSLTGQIPDISRMPNLTYLDLSWNLLSGGLPLNLSRGITTVVLSKNQLNGSIPESYSTLHSLQKLSLEDNFLTGSVSSDIWENRSFSSAARLILDFRSNILSSILGDLDPPDNVTLRLRGNPLCRNANIRNFDLFCGPPAETDDIQSHATKSTVLCPLGACPTGSYFEYVKASPIPCFCAAPIRIGYRLKSPSFSYFPTYEDLFELYLIRFLNLQPYQVLVDSYFWEEGPRLRMHLKLYPVYGDDHSGTFNISEILRIRGIFTSWEFPGSDFFGPYELLNFSLLGPYSYVNFNSEGKSMSKSILIAVVLAAIIISVTASVVITVLIIRRRDKFQHPLLREESKLSIKIEGVREFSFEELALATNNFSASSQVGQGGYGTVYRGILFDRTVGAIKRAKECSFQGQREFLTEIELLSRLHHRNLVSLLGYCDEESEQMLVYEFMANGTLRDWLSGKSGKTLNFGARLRIALGAARGILYLHTEANPPIFHRDIKASNILLDSKLTAKVADFGLSRLAPVLDGEGSIPDYVSTIVRGTPGYLDPEYFLTRKLSDKSDVYSLGVVFLEILTGRHPILHGKNLVREVNMARKSGAMFTIIDSRMGAYPSECVDRFINLALKCCQDKPDGRPSMLDVVREVENILAMLPGAGVYSLESTSNYFPESGTSPSFCSSGSGKNTRNPCLSSNVSEGDLVSGISLTITPR